MVRLYEGHVESDPEAVFRDQSELGDEGGFEVAARDHVHLAQSRVGHEGGCWWDLVLWWLSSVDNMVDRDLTSSGPAGVQPVEVDERYQINTFQIIGFFDVCIDLLGEKGSPVLLSVDNVGLVDVLPKSRG